MAVAFLTGGRRRRPRDRRVALEQFNLQCRAAGIDLPSAEFRFAEPEREWRFDLAWPARRLAMEIQGALFARIPGRHARGAALRLEHEKLNAAAAIGWRVLFVMPEDLDTGAALFTLAAAWRPATDSYDDRQLAARHRKCTGCRRVVFTRREACLKCGAPMVLADPLPMELENAAAGVRPIL